MQHFSGLASLDSSSGWIESYMVENIKDIFSCFTAHICWVNTFILHLFFLKRNTSVCLVSLDVIMASVSPVCGCVMVLLIALMEQMRRKV